MVLDSLIDNCVIAPAKVNLSLHVVGQRSDGYHLIDSLVGFTEFGDSLEFAPGETLSLTISGPESGGLPMDDQNLVLRAAKALRDYAGQPELAMAIHLKKRLPIASGIGGGSADAAGALLGLNSLWKLGLNIKELSQIGLALGADIPMCLHRRTLRATGIGDGIEPIHLPSRFLVLVNPRVEVSTPSIFQALQSKSNPPIDENILAKGWDAISSFMRNDLQAPAVEQFPVIGGCLAELHQQDGCSFARMSGSGATCFGIFSNELDAEKAAANIQATNKDWWVIATRLIV